MLRKFYKSAFLLGALFWPFFSQASSPAWDYFAPVTLSDVEDLIEHKNIQSIDELVPQLPEVLRANALFMVQGEALLEASPQIPRVILWSEQGKMAITFKSRNAGRGEDVIEAFEYNEMTKQFQFLVLDFKTKTFNADRKCAECHGVNARPIWRQYPQWPGSIGAHDDLVSEEERAVMANNNWWTLPRLKPLVPSENAPQLSSGWPGRDRKGDAKDSSQLFERPNMRFGVFANRLMVNQMVDFLEDLFALESATPRWDEYLEFMKGLANCSGSEGALEAFERVGLKAATIDIRAKGDSSEYLALTKNDLYFDGTGTLNELVLAKLLPYFDQKNQSDLFSKTWSMAKKYPDVSEINHALLPWLQFYDSYATWFPIPYPRAYKKLQNRETWTKERQSNYENLCEQLTTLKGDKNEEDVFVFGIKPYSY